MKVKTNVRSGVGGTSGGPGDGGVYVVPSCNGGWGPWTVAQ